MVVKMNPLPAALITAISDVLAQTDAPGLTGSGWCQVVVAMSWVSASCGVW